MKKNHRSKLAEKAASERLALNAELTDLAKGTMGSAERKAISERLAKLYADLLAGDHSAGDKIIKEGARLAEWQAGQFARSNEHRKRHSDLLASRAAERLVETVRALHLHQKPKKNIFTYLVVATRNALARCLHDAETIAGESFDTVLKYREPWIRDNPKEIGLDQCKRNRRLYNDILCGYCAARESMLCENQSLVERIADAELAASSSETDKKRGALIRLGMIALVDLVHGFGKPHSTGKVVRLNDGKENRSAVSGGTSTEPKFRQITPAECDEQPQTARQRVPKSINSDMTREEHRAHFERSHDDFRAQCNADYAGGRRHTFHSKRRIVKRNVNQSIVWAIRTAMRRKKGIGERLGAPDVLREERNWIELMAGPEIDWTFAEIHDSLDFCCSTKREHRAITLHIEGYRDAEIAESLGVPSKTVNRWINDVKKRFIAHWNAIDELSHGAANHGSRNSSLTASGEIALVEIKAARDFHRILAVHPDSAEPTAERDQAATKNGWLRVDSQHQGRGPHERSSAKTAARALARLLR